MIKIETIVRLLEAKKAENVMVLNLTDAFVDHMVIATASSQRQLMALADAITAYAKENSVLPLVDGANQSDWVVVDIGFALIHLFKPESRLYYNLEKMWGHDALGQLEA